MSSDWAAPAVAGMPPESEAKGKCVVVCGNDGRMHAEVTIRLTPSAPVDRDAAVRAALQLAYDRLTRAGAVKNSEGKTAATVRSITDGPGAGEVEVAVWAALPPQTRNPA